MGTFFTNVQVRVVESPEATLARVVASLEALAADQQQRVARADEQAVRTIVVLPGAEWMAVYDESTEDQNASALDELARTLSKATDDYTLSSLVHDNSVLLLTLFRSGRISDRFSSAPDYFERVTRAERAKLAGNPKRWNDLLLARGASREALADAFATAELFADKTLARVAQLIGIEVERAATGYRYLTERESLPPGAVAIRLVEATAAAEVRTPAKLSFQGAMCGGNTFVGEKADWTVHVRNLGASAKGLELMLWGDAIDQELIAPEEATFTREAGRGKRDPDPRVARFERVTVEGGRPAFIATFSDLLVPAAESAQGAKRRSPFGDPQFSVSFVVTALRAGSASFNAGVVCPSVKGSSIGLPLEIAIGRPARRPLRCGEHVSSHALEHLEQDNRLFALMSFGHAAADTPQAALEVVQRWTTFWPEDGTCHCALFAAGEGSGLKEFETRTAKLFSDSKSRLRRAFDTAARIDVQQRTGDGMAGLFTCHGFSYGGSLGGHAPSDELRCLLLWAEVTRLSSDQLRNVEDLAEQACDLVMREHSGVQALMGRWGSPGLVLDSTPYESASGVHQAVSLRAAWQKRFLRGVTRGPLWLSAELVHALGDLAPLRALAELVPIGTGLKVKPAPSTSLDAFERALAPLLPSRADYERIRGE